MMIEVSRLHIFPSEKAVGQPTKPGYIAISQMWLNEKHIDSVTEIVLGEKDRQTDWFNKFEEYTKETDTKLFTVLLESGCTIQNVLLTKEKLLKLTL